MKKLTFIPFFLSLLVSSTLVMAEDTKETKTVAPAPFVEGTQYTTRTAVKSEQPTLEIFFSYYCPHCFRFEPVIETYAEESKYKDDLIIKRIPVDFMGGPMGKILQQVHAASELLSVSKDITPALFEEIHVKKNTKINLDRVKEIFEEKGISEEKFNGAYNSFLARAKTKEYAEKQKSYAIQSVPQAYMNQIYKIERSKLSSVEQMYALFDYLGKL